MAMSAKKKKKYQGRLWVKTQHPKCTANKFLNYTPAHCSKTEYEHIAETNQTHEVRSQIPIWTSCKLQGKNKNKVMFALSCMLHWTLLHQEHKRKFINSLAVENGPAHALINHSRLVFSRYRQWQHAPILFLDTAATRHASWHAHMTVCGYTCIRTADFTALLAW